MYGHTKFDKVHHGNVRFTRWESAFYASRVIANLNTKCLISATQLVKIYSELTGSDGSGLQQPTHIGYNVTQPCYVLKEALW